MTTDTLTYAFGETPHEVIREQADTGDLAYYGCAGNQLWEGDTDDLLTMLDALAWAAAYTTMHGMTKAKATEARKLRIDILAALGVTES